jgi:hypothetical protein
MKFDYFKGNSFSELYGSDIDSSYAFLLSYPTTADWSAYPNGRKYIIQDGNEADKKVTFDKVFQKEPWKIMAVLGDQLGGILIARPPQELLDYWQEIWISIRKHGGFAQGFVHGQAQFT